MSANLFRYITKKTLTFGLTGALGALVGSGCTEFFLSSESSGIGGTILHVSIWTAIISLGIAIALLTTQNIYLKKKVFSKSILSAAFRGVITGGIAGGIAQIAFYFTASISVPVEIISRIICWGIFGLGTGWGISKFVPNYPQKTAMIAGFLGGVIGGAAFRFSISYLPEVASRLLGVAIVGFFIGLMISYIEELFREAWLTVVWGKDEKTSITLGAKPIVLGSSSEADIYLPKEKGFPPITAVIKIHNSKVVIENKINNQTTELRNGSKIQLGSIDIIINTK
jgi:Ca-activated chloride channel family protein